MSMNLELNGIKVSVDDAEVTRMLMERLAAKPSAKIDRLIYGMPRIGTYWPGQGGIFTGICAGRDNGPDQIIITAEQHLDPDTWDAQNEKAKDFTADGHSDFTLPWRPEQALQFANIRDRFKEEAYWSREQYRENADYAWYADFSNGYQLNNRKVNRLRAVLVRRIAIS